MKGIYNPSKIVSRMKLEAPICSQKATLSLRLPLTLTVGARTTVERIR